MFSEENLKNSEGNEEIIVNNTNNRPPVPINLELINLNFENVENNTNNEA